MAKGTNSAIQNKNNKSGSKKGKNDRKSTKKSGKIVSSSITTNYNSSRSIKVTDNKNEGNDSQIPGVLKTNLNGIFGIPYQFMSSVDTRIGDTNIGRKYAEKIVSRLPLLFITPCKQKFMAGFDDQDKETVLNALIEAGGLKQGSLNSTGRYYTTEFDYATYYKYVNKMMTSLCYFTGMGDKVVGIDGTNKKLKDINWKKAVNDSFKNYFAASSAVVFYLDGLNSMNESFSNSTTESQLASTINGFSDTANEIKFLLGDNSGLTKLLQETSENIGNAIGKITDKFSDFTGGMLSDLASTGVSTIVSGGKIIFPKLWQDSTFDRSYSFDIKLRSPDHDTLSILLNVLAPYVHLLALVLPRNLDDNNPNGYSSPFLVKAYCKGMFNIDMGIITDLSVTRGAECQWNDDGLPTQIDISITIEDLYSSLFMTDSKLNVAVVKNTAMMDFLANMAGLNIADMELGRKTKMFAYLGISEAKRIPSSIWNKFDTGVANLMKKLYSNI